MKDKLSLIKGTLDELKAALAKFPKPEAKTLPVLSLQSRADCCSPVAECCEPPKCEVCFSDLEYVHMRIESLYREFAYIWEALRNHQTDHLPPIQGAARMQKALEALGLDGDFETKKRIIYSSTGEPDGAKLELTFKK